MKSSFNVRTLVAALVVAGLLLLPLYTSLSGNVFALTLFTRIVIFALAAASLNLIMGYGGMMSFGHAAYLGIGGYAVGHAGDGTLGDFTAPHEAPSRPALRLVHDAASDKSHPDLP